MPMAGSLNLPRQIINLVILVAIIRISKYVLDT